MSNGRDTLVQLDRTLKTARAALHSLHEKVQHTNLQLARTRQREAGAYRALASLRLDQIRDDTFLSKLDAADQRARELLSQRQSAWEELRQSTDESRQRQEDLEKLRQSQNRLLEEAAAQLEQRLSGTHERLRAEPGYQDAQSLAQQRVDQAAAAEEKTRLAMNDKDVKGLPYRNDRLFMYLWDKGYGTEQYLAGPLIRFIDRRMARHIGFEQARRNYFMLGEIPRRLEEHTGRLEAQASEAMAALDRLEREAEIADGVAALEQALEEARVTLLATDKEIESEEQRYAGLVERGEAFAIGQDPYFSEALEVLVSNFRTEPIPQLRAEAESTQGYGDDTEVEKLAALREEVRALEAGLEEKRSLHRRHTARVHELEDLRRDFKQANFDAPNSRFADAETLAMMMAEFLSGQVDIRQLWKALKRSQRFVRTRSYPHPQKMRIPDGIRIPSGGRLPRGIRIPGGWGGGRGPRIRIPKLPGSGGFRTGGGF